ncbi:M23 family metallopeptidase [Treponema sp. OMZ 840]|uniref:LysM peptidoglycan-binding domain-containing M23 family metallopeptidase n=1 Tax=Treponema sp. OMZ 840 TaxID=244313 RepID=UPI003D8F99BA
MKKTDLFYIILFWFCTAAQAASSPHTPYPEIQKLHVSDPLFQQYIQEVEANYRIRAKGGDAYTSFYIYKVKNGEDLLNIAARCNIPYETIALVNNISFIDSPLENKVLYLSTCSGLFIPKKPLSPLEFILKTRYPNEEGFSVYTVGNSEYAFIPDARLNPTERFFFADSNMTSPLATGVISSSFGIRISPITGRKSFHSGIDIAADEGTPVFACKSGITAFTGTDERYGNYIILQHDNNTQSLYAHLQTILTKKGQPVIKGKQIGTVGNSGLSTGPHLHFEIQVGGKAKDPSSLIKKFLREY